VVPYCSSQHVFNEYRDGAEVAEQTVGQRTALQRARGGLLPCRPTHATELVDLSELTSRLAPCDPAVPTAVAVTAASAPLALFVFRRACLDLPSATTAVAAAAKIPSERPVAVKAPASTPKCKVQTDTVVVFAPSSTLEPRSTTVNASASVAISPPVSSILLLPSRPATSTEVCSGTAVGS
jgi:hypothetical protein